jgi:hypothetical protein
LKALYTALLPDSKVLLKQDVPYGVIPRWRSIVQYLNRTGGYAEYTSRLQTGPYSWQSVCANYATFSQVWKVLIVCRY